MATYDGLRRDHPRSKLTAELLWIDTKHEAMLLNGSDLQVPGRQEVASWYDEHLDGRWNTLCKQGEVHEFESHWAALTRGASGCDLIFYEDSEAFCNPFRIQVRIGYDLKTLADYRRVHSSGRLN